MKTTLAPAKDILQQQNKTIKNSLNLTQMIQFLESTKKLPTIKEVIQSLQLPTVVPQIIITQLQSIYPKVTDRSTKIRITKTIEKMSKEFKDGLSHIAVEP